MSQTPNACANVQRLMKFRSAKVNEVKTYQNARLLRRDEHQTDKLAEKKRQAIRIWKSMILNGALFVVIFVFSLQLCCILDQCNFSKRGRREDQ